MSCWNIQWPGKFCALNGPDIFDSLITFVRVSVISVDLVVSFAAFIQSTAEF